MAKIMAEEDIVTTPEAKTSPTVATLGSEGMHEFIRYFLASGIALAVDVGSLTLLTSFVGIPYLTSGAIAFLLGLVVIYILSVYWVFAHRMFKNPAIEFMLFAVIGVIGLGLNELALFVGTGLLGAFYLISKVVSIVIVFSWNFAARKWLLFRTHPRT
jgi:putative flippase GtrA